jgi:hypothetical protein
MKKYEFEAVILKRGALGVRYELFSCFVYINN